MYSLLHDSFSFSFFKKYLLFIWFPWVIAVACGPLLPCAGSFPCGTWAQDMWDRSTRDWTHGPSIARQNLNHSAIREVLLGVVNFFPIICKSSLYIGVAKFCLWMHIFSKIGVLFFFSNLLWIFTMHNLILINWSFKSLKDFPHPEVLKESFTSHFFPVTLFLTLKYLIHLDFISLYGSTLIFFFRWPSCYLSINYWIIHLFLDLKYTLSTEFMLNSHIMKCLLSDYLFYYCRVTYLF